MSDAAQAVAAALSATDPLVKVRLTHALAGTVDPQKLVSHEVRAAVGRPERPLLVAPARLPRRRLGSREGHAALMHAIAHIEFNAINLALDAAWRFNGMPGDYYRDWLAVAAEEATHFDMVRRRLEQLGFAYGNFDAHDGLWRMAEQTAGDVLLRMALVPRVLEARGLDVTPGMRDRLARLGDSAGVAILDVIARDEVGHVAAGTRWFRHVCACRGLEPDTTFKLILKRAMKRLPSGPFELDARARAGFSQAELDWLAAPDGPRAARAAGVPS